ncbi:MAG: hypothetical protein ACRC78_06490 [Planktothrix sp.]
MNETELIELALKNARSHCAIKNITLPTLSRLQSEISSKGMEQTKTKLWHCAELEYLTSIILDGVGYEGTRRKFCNSGLSCDCDIPCG